MCKRISFCSDIPQGMRDILDVIAKELKQEYNDIKAITPHHFIQNVFQRTSGHDYSKMGIIERLITLEAYYSTNAAYSYFSFEEMAESILHLGNESEAKKYFAELSDYKDLFSRHFGIHKNLSDGDLQVSLLSKYAYFQLFRDVKYPLGFPIADRLAHIAYPKACEMINLSPMPKYKMTSSITKHIEAFNELRKAIWTTSNETYYDIQQFDLLDTYLWRMGKFISGNIGNLMSKDDYILFINNIGLACLQNETDMQYKARLYKTYSSVVSSKIISCNQQKNSCTLNFDGLVLHILENYQQTKSPFTGLTKQEYLNALYYHWKKYYLK